MPNSQRTASPKQFAANRANATRSTGPRTPEGKARSAQNARKHGFTASTYTAVEAEDLHEVAKLRADLLASYQPVDSREILAIESMACAQQALFRSMRIEADLFTGGADGRNYWPLERALPLLMRYRAKTERDYRRALDAFDQLKALRGEFPTEPNIRPNLNQRNPLAPQETNPPTTARPSTVPP
jgi:hypothetical protein